MGFCQKRERTQFSLDFRAEWGRTSFHFFTTVCLIHPVCCYQVVWDLLKLFFFFAAWLHLSVWNVINRNIKLTRLLFATCNSRGLLNLLQAPQGWVPWWLASHLHMTTASEAVADNDFQWYNHAMDLFLKGQSELIWLYGVTMGSLQFCAIIEDTCPVHLGPQQTLHIWSSAFFMPCVA